MKFIFENIVICKLKFIYFIIKFPWTWNKSFSLFLIQYPDVQNLIFTLIVRLTHKMKAGRGPLCKVFDHYRKLSSKGCKAELKFNYKVPHWNLKTKLKEKNTNQYKMQHKFCWKIQMESWSHFSSFSVDFERRRK